MTVPLQRLRAWAGRPGPWWLAGWLAAWLAGSRLPAADFTAATADFARGRYEAALKTSGEALAEDSVDEGWQALRLESLLTLGRYPEARSAATNAVHRVPRSLRLRWLAREAHRRMGDTARARALTEEIAQLVTSRTWMYRDAASLVVFGRAILELGADPKEVLDKAYAGARKADPPPRDAFLAAGELALSKHDAALAARHFDEGLARYPDDVELLHGRARAFSDGSRAEAMASIERIRELNPRHVPTLLLLADHRIDAEDYDGARELLGAALEVNPWHPEAWAYRALLAHLHNDADAERTARESALRYWSGNPEVDHLIGRKLSQKYRFAEGAALQQRVLGLDPGHLAAKGQLASDLLRLGRDAEGWRLAHEVHEADGYDVTAFNLVNLHDAMTNYVTVTNEHLILRMHRTEAPLYAGRVLTLLSEARERVGVKYGLLPAEPVVVEVFSDSRDFGVRTFGMPGNPGYLGVCFGKVITANSPAVNQGRAVNWEAVLWHEFCHVITLQKTRNRMPRWLSEGISVHEERQANPAWGQHMDPKYRTMILGKDLVPVSRLSAAFLMPKSGLHLQFAYFESSMVVEYLIGRFGMEKLRAVLDDLAEGVFINDALARHTVPMDQLDRDFADHARETARALGGGLEWEEPDPELLLPGAEERRQRWVKANPDNFWALRLEASRLADEGRWAEAVPVLRRLWTAYPGDVGADGSGRLLARALGRSGDAEGELAVLRQVAERDMEAVDVYQRLMELGETAGDWESVRLNARRYLAVDPLVPVPYRHLAAAGEALDELELAASAWEKLLLLRPPNPSEVHFQLARIRHRQGDPRARRSVLQALEEAPRYRAALELLQQLAGDGPTGN